MSIKLLAFAAALAVPSLASAATATTTTKPRAAAPAPAKARPAPDPAQVMASMMKIMDVMFPAGPEPEPARLVLARDATLTMFPRGAYAQAINGFVDRTVDRVLSMSEAELTALAPDAKKAGTTPPSTEPLRVVMNRKDPSFDAKVAAGKAFAQTMFVKVGDVTEPRFREGMARMLARRFDARQLGEIRAFLATPTGAAYGREMVGMWFEPDVLRGSIEALPELMRMAPDLAKSADALEQQMRTPKAK